MHKFYVQRWCKESGKSLGFDTLFVLIEHNSEALTNPLLDQEPEEWLIQSHKSQDNSCGEHWDSRDIINNLDILLSIMPVTPLKACWVEKMVITGWELDSPNDNEEDNVNGVFVDK